MADPADIDLVRDARDGCPRAARALYERHAPRVQAVLMRMVRREDLARDLAQETWMKAFRALPRFREEARFSTWIHRIAVNAALSSLRGPDRRWEDVAVAERLPWAGGPERDVFLAERLAEALRRLPEGMRRIILLHDVHGLTHREIATRLEISPGTSKSQLFRARGRMREILEEAGVVRDTRTADEIRRSSPRAA